MLKKVGITVNIKIAAYAALISDVLDGQGGYDMFLSSRSYILDIGDPGSYLISDYTCKGSLNYSRICDPALDTEIAKATSIADTQARYAQYADLASQLQTQAVAVFLVNPTAISAYSTTLHGYIANPFAHYTLTQNLIFTR